MFVIAIIATVLAVIAIGIAVFARFESERRLNAVTGKYEVNRTSGPNKLAGFIGGILVVIAALFFVFSSAVPLGVGEAKVIVNPDGTVGGEPLTKPGLTWKAPWQDVIDFDTFQQPILFAGSSDSAPSYSGGEVNGAEVTASVKGGAQGYVDIQLVYGIDADKVKDIYTEYRSQERFTSQVIVPTLLSAIRDVPSAYTPVEFRGEKRGEATTKILETANADLEPYGVELSSVNLQDIRYTEQVEESIKQVEVAQQKEEKAQAELRAATVTAQQKVVEAQAEADATAIRNSQQPTGSVLSQQYIEMLKSIGGSDGKGVIIVPEGFGGIINLPGQTPAGPPAQ